MEHYLRFGSHAEAKIFKEIKKHNFGITINANVIAHTPLSISKLLFIQLSKKDYFIDPQTYIFQVDPIKYYSATKGYEVVLKESIEVLLGEYKTQIADSVKKLQQPDFNVIKNNLKQLTENVIEFQVDFLNKTFNKFSKEVGYSEYYKLFEKKNGFPKYLIPPYFFLTLDNAKGKNISEWLELNIQAIKFSERHKAVSKELLAAELVLDNKLLLDEKKLNEIAKAYNSIDVKTIFLWIDQFDTYDQTHLVLKNYIVFLKKFKNKKIISLYGSFFDLLLTKEKVLGGFCHGPGYGEHRGVKPVGGGIPTAKFYLPSVYQRIRAEDAESIIAKKELFNSKYFSQICDCVQCKKILKGSDSLETDFLKGYSDTQLSKKGRETPTSNTLKNNQLHYLYKRFFENQTMTVKKFIEDSALMIKWLSENTTIAYDYLIVWKKIFDEEK